MSRRHFELEGDNFSHSEEEDNANTIRTAHIFRPTLEYLKDWF